MHIQLNKNGIVHLRTALFASLRENPNITDVPDELFKKYEKIVLQSLIKPTSESFNGTSGFATTLFLEHPLNKNNTIFVNFMTTDFEIIE